MARCLNYRRNEQVSSKPFFANAFIEYPLRMSFTSRSIWLLLACSSGEKCFGVQDFRRHSVCSPRCPVPSLGGPRSQGEMALQPRSCQTEIRELLLNLPIERRREL